MKIQTIIVDDEPLARERIRTLLQNEPEFQIVAECKNGAEALEELARTKPDLVFLDVQMPEIDGLEVLKKLAPESAPMVVFVTAYDKYAVQAFDHYALDYLLKPFDRQRFSKTIQRIRERILNDHDGFRGELWQMFENIKQRLPGRSEEFLSRLAVKSAGKIIVVDLEKVDWIEAAGNYLELHIGSKSCLHRATMNDFERRVDPQKFLRIHRSTMVNIGRVRELKPHPGGEFDLILNNDVCLTSSRGYRERIQNYLAGIR